PTPGVAYLTRTFQAQAGIVISASHNSYVDNGIKFFGGNGTKLPDELERLIEEELEKPMVTAEKLGKARRISDASGRYIEFCKGTMPWGFNLKGLQIVLDCAHGATYNIAPDVFGELGAKIIPMFVEPNGTNINRSCGSTKPEALQEKVIEVGADLGIAFDGDGDRVVFVDHKGEIVDGDELLYIIAKYQQEYAGGCDGVVGTLMSNFGFELGLKKLGVPFARAKVGDRYVIELMRQNGWRLGGENSGHIVCSNVTTTGDGIISALQVLLAITTFGESLYKIKKGMNKMPQVMINVHMAKRVDLSTDETVQSAVKATEEKLAGTGRVLLRPSGTEPVVRVMVEGEDKKQVKELAQELAKTVELALS
ncbi:MAG: phosphoglucosamine mutase, partial [Moraxellaceae bacterium]